MRSLIVKSLLLAGLAFIAQDYCAAQQPSGVRKLKDVVIYSDPDYYAAFPSVVRRRTGEIIVAFRRAPARTIFKEENYTHTDANSYLVLVRSSDGETWTKEPELIYAHPFGGSQDPCLIQLRDKTLLCTSYGWSFVRPEGIAKMKKPVSAAGDFVFLGGYVLRSTDGVRNGKARFTLLVLSRKSISMLLAFLCLPITGVLCLNLSLEGFTGLLQPGIPNHNPSRLPTLFVLTTKELRGNI